MRLPFAVVLSLSFVLPATSFSQTQAAKALPQLQLRQPRRLSLRQSQLSRHGVGAAHTPRSPIAQPKPLTTPSGATINTFAGGALPASGLPALSRGLGANTGLAIANNTLYFCGSDLNQCYAQTASGKINVIAGTGVAGFSGDGGPATSARLSFPYSIAADAAGNLYISDLGVHVIRKVNAATGIITTVAGTPNVSGSTGDGGPATSAALNEVLSIAIAPNGDLFLADLPSEVVRKVTASTGIISTVAGVGRGNPYGCTAEADQFGDGCPATQALIYPYGVALQGNSSSGTLFIADSLDDVQQINLSTGIVSLVAGGPFDFGYGGDGGPATDAMLHGPLSVAVDNSGTLYFTEFSDVRSVNLSTGIIETLAGTDYQGYGGDGGPAIDALIDPQVGGGLVADASGNVYIGDSLNERIRQVNAAGTINTVAGNGTGNVLGNGGSRLSAGLLSPTYMRADSAANLYIADYANNAVRKIDAATGVMTEFAGNGQNGFSGDGGSAAASELELPLGVQTDRDGNVLISANSLIRRVSAATGTISSIAGIVPGSTVTGCAAQTDDFGDGCPALEAEIGPTGLVVAPNGDIIFADATYNAVRKISAASNLVSVVAGTPGMYGYAGDGGPATAAELSAPYDVALDADGNLYIADYENNVIRKVSATTGDISTVAGTGTAGYTGDGGAATSAQLSLPVGIALDAAGNLYIGDSGNQAMREVVASSAIITTVAGNGTVGFAGDGGLATAAELYVPETPYVDGDGNLFVLDAGNNRIRRVAVSPVTLTAALAASPAHPAVGENVTLSVRFTGPIYGTLPTGTVRFLYGSEALGTATLKNGVASLTASTKGLPVGSYNVTAKYSGDANYKVVTAAPVVVKLGYATTTTASANPQTVPANSKVTLSAHVTSANGTPAGTVSFYFGSELLGSATLKNGAASITASDATVPAGNYAVVAEYSGDATHAPSSGSVVVTVE